MNFNRIFFICTMMVGMQMVAMEDATVVVAEPGKDPLTAMAQVKSPFSTATEEQLKAAMDLDSSDEATPIATESVSFAQSYAVKPVSEWEQDFQIFFNSHKNNKEMLFKGLNKYKYHEHNKKINERISELEQLEKAKKEPAPQSEPATPRSQARAELKPWPLELDKFETEIALLENPETFDGNDHTTYVESVSTACEVAADFKKDKAAILQSDEGLRSEIEGICKRLTGFQERLDKAKKANDKDKKLKEAAQAQDASEFLFPSVIPSPAVSEPLSTAAAAINNSTVPQIAVEKPAPFVRQESQLKLDTNPEIPKPTPQPVTIGSTAPASLTTPTKSYNWKAWLGIGAGVAAVAATVIWYFWSYQKPIASH